MVLPFTNYTVTVTASTSAGQGDSGSVIEMSPDAGKQHYMYLLLYTPAATYNFFPAPSPVMDLTVSSNSTHITVIWQEPAEPNCILQYTVFITGKDAGRQHWDTV